MALLSYARRYWRKSLVRKTQTRAACPAVILHVYLDRRLLHAAWMLPCVLQVARDLQAVCRPNPKKFRASCRKDKKHKRSADQQSTGVERKLTFDVSSESEIEILSVQPSMAMETTFCPAEAYCRGPNLCISL